METVEARACKKVEDLDSSSVVMLLEQWEMGEFVEFAREKELDGRTLLDVTEGIVKLWRPKINAKKFLSFIEDLKINSEKYLNKNEDIIRTEMAVSIESQYQTVRKVKEQNLTTTTNTIDELLKRIVPAKSFLYRNQLKKTDKIPSYLPMDSSAQKKKKFFRLSSYEYPFFDLRSKFSRQETANDSRYYSMKTNSRYYIQKAYKKPDSRPKYTSLTSAEEIDKYPEDHFYEDLCYNDVEKENGTKRNSLNQVVVVKPCIVKIQELFQSFKMPFFRRTEEAIEDIKVEVKEEEREKEVNLYENSDSISNMYDSVHVIRPVNESTAGAIEQAKLPVEDYLEPVQVNKDYCDVSYKQKDDSLLGYIMSIFENRFGYRRETNDPTQSEDSASESHKPASTPEDGKWEEWRGKNNMADRPLPVPVENETYYMNIDRGEAENLLRGQPDGTFVLRPSSQSNHAYTLTVSCSNAVHNVGVRRRTDGRLALGFPRRGERSFTSVTSLLRHHRKRRLLLVAAGGVIGGTTLNETPHYYQVPSSIPVVV